jgi:hypothetical protein
MDSMRTLESVIKLQSRKSFFINIGEQDKIGVGNSGVSQHFTVLETLKD